MSSLIPAVGKAAAQVVANNQNQAPPRDAVHQPHAMNPAALSQAASQRTDALPQNKNAPRVPKRVERGFEGQEEKKKSGPDAEAEEIEEPTEPQPLRKKGTLRAVA